VRDRQNMPVAQVVCGTRRSRPANGAKVDPYAAACVRWRHPLAPDVSLIQTLAPGAELAVPVANAREGELCLQPAGNNTGHIERS